MEGAARMLAEWDDALEQQKVSTIVAVAHEAEAAFLEETLFSLAIQDWRETEVLVVLRAEEAALAGAVEGMIARQPWSPGGGHRVLTAAVPPGSNARSVLFNHGASHARGRFLAFLDAGVVVYQDGYAALVRRLLETECAVAVGHCRTAFVQEESGHWFVLAKDYPVRDAPPPGLHQGAPTCARVLDRTRVREADIPFDERRPPHEDAELLPRQCATRGAEFSEAGVSICERRLRIVGLGRVRFAARHRLRLYFKRHPRLRARVRPLIPRRVRA